MKKLFRLFSRLGFLIQFTLNRILVSKPDILVDGGIFVVPNRSHNWGQRLCTPLWYERVATKDFMRLNGLKLTRDTRFVQVWAIDGAHDNSNFDCHGVPIPRYEKHLRGFPSFLPAELLADKKEGDEIRFIARLTLPYPESHHHLIDTMIVEFRLIACQCTTRYARFGKFQDALRHVGVSTSAA